MPTAQALHFSLSHYKIAAYNTEMGKEIRGENFVK